MAATAAMVALSAMLQGCSMDEPFGRGGEGSLSINTEMNGDTRKTRAVPQDLKYLEDNCVVYLESYSKGLLRKYKGVDNIPESIRLSSGSYVCNAWSGDSTAASFTDKFYRGQQDFEITENQNTSLTVKCNIANVVVSVDPASLNVGLKDMKVSFSTTRGELVFDETNIPEGKGYFMTPSPEMVKKDAEAYAANTEVTVKVQGTKEDGSAYEKVHVIKDVQRAHEYCVTVTKDDSEINEGGALITLVIQDILIIEDSVDVFTAPVVKGVGFDIEDQIVSLNNGFKDTRVRIHGYRGLSSIIMNLSDNFTDMESGMNLKTESVKEQLAAKGIIVEEKTSVDAATNVEVDDVYVTFRGSYLNGLAPSASEYCITFEATDGEHRTGTGALHIANTEDAVTVMDDIVVDPAPDTNANPMAITGNEALLTSTLYKADATSYGIKYRVAGSSDWITVPAEGSSPKQRRVISRVAGKKVSVRLTGLKPGTTYEYVGYADDFVSDNVQTFKTESAFVLPNYSFEDWSTYQAGTMLGTKTVTFPGTGNAPTFWDSGNEGAATANKTLTDKSTDMKHSGTYSARLASSSAMGMLAAGNVFVGDYVETDGTNGVLALGRNYNGSHPTKVRVYANYRPGTVDIIKSGNEGFLDFAKGDSDHGQIYVALTVGTVDIRTNPSKRKLFNPDDEQVLAYGQVTWTSAFGPDGELQKIEIPFTYNDRAQTTRPTHLVIVACASKFGDFFSGSSKSVLYLDDFELVYE